jgi:transposase-like protein
MNTISYRNLHFPSSIIQRAVWLYARFNLSLRDVEELMAERGVEVSYETIRRWVKRFGPAIARGLRRGRPRAHPQWHLNESATKARNGAAQTLDFGHGQPRQTLGLFPMN